jgi:hypothetical protein
MRFAWTPLDMLLCKCRVWFFALAFALRFLSKLYHTLLTTIIHELISLFYSGYFFNCARAWEVQVIIGALRG